MEKAKALHLQVQTATFQKLEADLDNDTTLIKDWADKEQVRKSSWQSMVLTHKRKRYVRGLAMVKKFSEEELAYVKVELPTCHMELASFRTNLDKLMPVHAEKRLTLGFWKSDGKTSLKLKGSAWNRFRNVQNMFVQKVSQ